MHPLDCPGSAYHSLGSPQASREGIYGRVLDGACHQVALNRRVRNIHATRASKGGATKRKGAASTKS